MRIKLDENLPVELVAMISSQRHDVDTVPAENLVSASDDVIWRAAQSANRVLITQDLDFSDVRRFEPGQHHGLILVRLHNPSRKRLIARLAAVVVSENIDEWASCFVVITDSKTRVRRPRKP
jgi:predicted nuclease of predicted toxin-antitoxin system